MGLLPGLEPFVTAVAAVPDISSGRTLTEARADAHAMMAAGIGALSAGVAPVAHEFDRSVPVDGGEITVRIYRPSPAGSLPVHVYIHGGGFWTGTLDHSDSACRRLASTVGCVVVSVAYRLSPEAPFPVPVEDCYSALCWVADRADELGVDASRISIGGVSAGGGLAAATALVARDCGGPPIVFQVLELPVTDLTMSQPSIDENASGPLLTRDGLALCAGYYLADPSQASHPYASPCMADDLSDLPAALVMTAELDPLRDEGELYAWRLEEDGVEVEQIRWAGFFHGCQDMDLLIPEEAAAYRAVVVASLRRAHGLADPEGPVVPERPGRAGA